MRTISHRPPAAFARRHPTFRTYLPRRIADALGRPWWYFVCAPGAPDSCLVAEPPRGGWGRAVVACLDDLAAIAAYRREERHARTRDPADLEERRLGVPEVPSCRLMEGCSPVVAAGAMILPQGDLRIAFGRLHRTTAAEAVLFLERIVLPAGVKYLRFEELEPADRFTAPIGEVVRAWKDSLEAKP